MKLRWSQRARRDLLDIGRYIARDNPQAARRWVQSLRDRARAAAGTPLAGRRLPEAPRDDLREVFVGSYRIVYRVLAKEIVILTVFEGHRLLPPDAIPDR
jgi:toxin ParE1/3/4